METFTLGPKVTGVGVAVSNFGHARKGIVWVAHYFVAASFNFRFSSSYLPSFATHVKQVRHSFLGGKGSCSLLIFLVFPGKLLQFKFLFSPSILIVCREKARLQLTEGLMKTKAKLLTFRIFPTTSQTCLPQNFAFSAKADKTGHKHREDVSSNPVSRH